jgi:uncharacterized repeat protein (TIGR01451 family)/fimbrial isopeptide formation D2 family protein
MRGLVYFGMTNMVGPFIRLGRVLFWVVALFFCVSQAQVALNFNDTTPTLETGTALTAGARYRFDDVAPGTDALVTIASINGGATLDELDDNVTGPFPNRFQPRIGTTAANSTGWVRFDFQLVAADTSTPRAVPGVYLSAQDVDATPVREFVEFVNTQAVTVASPTLLVSLPALAGGTRYGYQSFTGFQSGIGTNNQYEVYTSLSNTATSFTIIGGSQVNTTACTGTGDTCSRRHSFTFDPPPSNIASPNANLSITKTGPASVNVGNTVTYTLVATNLGTPAATGSTITDNVPAGLTGVTISCAATGGAVCPTTTGLTTLSNVFITTFPNGGQLTFTITGTATAGPLSNVATIAVPNGATDPTPANNTSATINTTVNVPDLTLAKADGGNFTVGSSGTYTLTVTNSGTAPTVGTITVTDTLPTGVTVNGGAAGGITEGGTNGANWTCNSNAATPQVITCTSTTAISNTGGNTSVFNFAVNVGLGTPVGTNSITNTASVSGGSETNTTNNGASDQTTVLSPNLTITKADTGNFTALSTGTYQITVGNTGTAATSGTITVSDTLPTGLTVPDGSLTLGGTNAGNWTCTAASNVITCSSATAIGTSGSSVFTFTVNVGANAPVGTNSISNTATVSGGNEATANNGNNSSTDTTTVNAVIGGTVFEDINYGGGAGRSLAASSGVVRPGVRVELYTAAGAFQSATLTNASGQYSFVVSPSTTYTVRVVNGFVTSSRTGGCTPSTAVATPPASCTQLAVQTFRTNGVTSNVGTADTRRVGGERPSVADTGAADTGAVMNTAGVFTTAGGSATLNGQAQSINRLTVGTATVTGVDFGYNFSTIVNTNDAGQGSLRQFITNSNALTGNSGLAQSGSTTNTRGVTSTLPTGKESSIFMIPNGTTRPGLLNTVASGLTSGVAVIQVSSLLPAITDSDTIIDGGTQTFNITNTNTTVLNTATTVGIDNLAVPAIAGPEVQLQPATAFYSTSTSGLTLGATNLTVQNISVYGFSAATAGTDDANIYINAGATGAVIRWNAVGFSATSYADPGVTARTTDYNIIARAGTLTIRENIVAYAGAGGIELYSGTSGILVEANELRGNAITNASAENLNVNTDGSNVMVRGNLSVNAGGPGFDTSGSTGGNTFENNTVTDNGTLQTGQTAGIRVSGDGNIIRKNIIGRNYGAGILVRRQDGSGTPTDNINNLISQNSIFANGTTGSPVTKQIGIDLLTLASESANTGTSPFVTTNDANDSDTGANNGLNFPVFESVVVSGSTLLLKGCAPALATIELFEADVSPGKSSAPGANTNAPRTLDYGEGETYLTTVTEGTGDTDNSTDCTTLSQDGNNQTGMVRFSFSVALPSGVAVGDRLTATATVSNNTSEFSAVVTATSADLGLAKALDRIIHSNNATDNVYTLVYRLTVENFGSSALSNLILYDDVVTQFSGLSPTNFNTWVSVPANAALLSPAGTLTRSGTWSGTSPSNILTTGQSLAANSTGIVYISFDVTVNPAAASPNNQLRDNSATTQATTASSLTLSDTSTNGTDPDGTDNDNNPDENTVTPTPFVKLVKEVRNCGNSLSSCSGAYGLTTTGRPGDYLEYRIRYYNISSQPISQLRAADTLASTTPFQEDTYAVISPNIADFNVTCPNSSTVELDRSSTAITTTPAVGTITAFSINIMAATACSLTTVTSGQQGQVLFKVRIP